MVNRHLSVIKIGGSVAHRVACVPTRRHLVANMLADEPGRQLVVVVSAEHGLTDALLASAQDLVPNPDPKTLDLCGPRAKFDRWRSWYGFGGMVSFELDGSLNEVVSLVSSFPFFALGESLGGVKSLVCHPARMTHASIPALARARLGLSDTLVRLSPGCEHRKDLVHDLIEGLVAIEQSREPYAKNLA